MLIKVPRMVLPIIVLSCGGLFAKMPETLDKEIRKHTRQLLTFHFNDDPSDTGEPTLGLDDEITQLPSIKNPGGKGTLQVFEIYANIYKGTYRMRFIYHYSKIGGYTLLGQEILEIANP